MTELSTKRPELIVALVCPLGANVDLLEKAIRDELEGQFHYESVSIRLSELLQNLDFWEPESDQSERTRITHRQDVALRFRRKGDAAVLARAAISEIRKQRAAKSGNPDLPANACAYVLRQLKHPEEIKLLRRVYGSSVVVIAGHAPERHRIKSLADAMARKQGMSSGRNFETDAKNLIEKDAKEELSVEEDDCGQNTRDAYPMADFFVGLSQGSGDSVRRFIQLLFGHPFHTPTPEEMAMHQANAMALRSSDERRQVGAVVVTRTKRSDHNLDADVVASGMNEVPRRQGGFFWDGESPDGRDQALRRYYQDVDREDRIKLDVLREIASRLKSKNWLTQEVGSLDEATLANQLLRLLRRTQFTDISEFMRQVHAEMAALVDAAKRGVAVRGGEMYVTTFPCHNCAKHIIAAGITKVIYLEPYPKSRAEILHEDEMILDPVDPKMTSDKVLFLPFAGVAPRQFPRLFSMSERGRKHFLQLKDWEDGRRAHSPRYILPNAAQAYAVSEREELALLPTEYRWEKAKLCPTS